MKNIEKFKKDRFYSGGRELTMEERIPLGLGNDTWQSLEDRAYQAAYDISEDWSKDNPDWNDVKEGFRRGVKEGIDFVKELIENKIKSYSESGFYDAPSLSQRISALEIMLDKINKEVEL